MALVLSVVIFFSVILKAFTHLFTLGYLPSPVLINILPHEGVVPSMEDDFGVALLKLGTACLEATQFSGLRNELVGIQEKQGPWVEISASGSNLFSTPKSLGGFGAEITKVEISELEDPYMDSAYWKELRTFWRAFFVNLAVFSWSVLMAVPGGRKGAEVARAAYHHRWWYGPRRWDVWRREAWAEPAHLRQRATLRRLEEVARRRRLTIDRYSHQGGVGVSTAITLRESTPQPIQYAQFLRGEIEVEDDEEDWQEGTESSSGASSSASDEEEEENLYRDLMAPTEPVEDLQPVLLAHLTSQTTTPLTRRRYAAILGSSSQDLPSQGLHDVVQDRRVAVQGNERDAWDDDRRRSCVVCTIEPRDTILWPCR